MSVPGNATVAHAWVVKDFVCTGAACPDTCCKGWSMQVDAQTAGRYQQQAPELLETLATENGEYVMRRDTQTDYCVKYDDGWCGIQKEKGTDFLGDACHFYPRITRTLGEHEIVSAALSCPEIARLALFAPLAETFSTQQGSSARLPIVLRDYLPEEMNPAEACKIHTLLVDIALSEKDAPERFIMHLLSLCGILEHLSPLSWADATAFYFNQAEHAFPEPESHPADYFNLLNVLLALIGASTHPPSPRLQQTLREMIAALHVTVDPVMVTLIVSSESAPALQQMQERWKASYSQAMAPVLNRWIAAQLSASTFPFAGSGETITERATLLAVRYATLTLALMSLCETAGALPAEEDIIRVVQSLSRFIDHLAESKTSLQLYRQVGFDTSARIGGIFSF